MNVLFLKEGYFTMPYNQNDKTRNKTRSREQNKTQSKPLSKDPDNDHSVSRTGKRGKDKSIRKKRTDHNIITEQGENTKYLTHDLKLFNLPEIDLNNAEQVKQRINEYLSICAEDDIKPSVASLALCLKLSRFNLFDNLNGKSNVINNPECIHTIKAVYDLINSYYEHMMNNGKINPVAGIFLMKNNLGYKDVTDYMVTAKQEQIETEEKLIDRSNLLTD